MDTAPRVLHICSDFAKQRIYGELVAHLDALGATQLVYVPVRSAGEIGVNRDHGLRHARYRYAHVLRPLHRLLFGAKIATVLRDLLAHADPAAFSAVHAHFLYSDGAVALKLHRRFKLPYVVAVRNTDVNYFMRLRPDLRAVCWSVVASAHRVVFVTPAYRELLLERAPASVRATLESKARIIPNGLSSFWLEHATSDPRAGDSTLKLLYVGDLTRNKNVGAIIRATALLNARRSTRLTIVGAGGDGERDVARLLAAGDHPFVTRLGRVDDRAQLVDVYRSHDIFVMPSFRETFGVAYLEALSQGLPVIFSRGQGVDGYFEPHSVGESVDPHDAGTIRDAVLAIAGRLDRVRPRCVEYARTFSWPRIAAEYADLYRAAAS